MKTPKVLTSKEERKTKKKKNKQKATESEIVKMLRFFCTMIILRFLLFNRRLLALNAVTAVNFASSQHGAAFCSSVDFLHRWRILRNNDHTSATKYCKVKGSIRGKKWMGEKNYALTSLTVLKKNNNKQFRPVSNVVLLHC